MEIYTCIFILYNYIFFELKIIFFNKEYIYKMNIFNFKAILNEKYQLWH